MNDTSMVTMSKTRASGGKLIGGQRARVDALDDLDARIAAQLPIELAVADVERDDAPRAALEQHVGESAGRGADVERRAVRSTSMREDVERVRELDPAAADVGMIGTVDRDLGVGGDAGARLGDRAAR